ncbi:DNA cytosine methyltransferase [Botrimarina hoheduenensis]|uniref:DNA (cytosine-5-)-methyltransferase n=1 Tax=Botrimarina hoheduenensis TaxID=2528000 RepID=A0A5C5VQ71_9BACT|nr:DNA (cytosine-5-)-methyltransferase [Botrimarina hoheduenensis]TWT40776.1 Modification methylase HhaI [Botrimarina hoheduenensis]
MEPQPLLFDCSPCPPSRTGWTAAEYFAGVGLARMGLEQAGWVVEFANDLDEQKHRMHRGHFGPSPHYVVEDIHRLSAATVPPTLLAHASFPCTDLSLAGARRGLNAGQSSAFWGWIDLLRRMGAARPPLVLIENVTGLLTSRDGADFRSLIAAINELGYAADAMVVDAAHFTPQSRPRLFVVGVQTEFAPDVNTHCLDQLEPTTVRPLKLVSSIRALGDLAWSLAALPEPPPYGARRLETVLDRDLPSDSPQWWNDERAEYLLNQMSERHRATAERMIAGTKTSYGTVFRRVRKGKSMAELRTDGLAGCLRTPKGGSGRQILFQAGGGAYRVRLLNADECARLMGADGYRVSVPLNQALFGFGDAVCVDAIAWVAQHRLNPVADRLLDRPPPALPAAEHASPHTAT